eukprot:4494773-Karenia_brevis.AAC.1
MVDAQQPASFTAPSPRRRITGKRPPAFVNDAARGKAARTSPTSDAQTRTQLPPFVCQPPQQSKVVLDDGNATSSLASRPSGLLEFSSEALTDGIFSQEHEEHEGDGDKASKDEAVSGVTAAG